MYKSSVKNIDFFSVIGCQKSLGYAAEASHALLNSRFYQQGIDR